MKIIGEETRELRVVSLSGQLDPPPMRKSSTATIARFTKYLALLTRTRTSAMRWKSTWTRELKTIWLLAWTSPSTLDSSWVRKRTWNQHSRTTLKAKLSKFLLCLNVREPVDKVYFRRRDEESMYAEARFKNKILAGKKWWILPRRKSTCLSPFVIYF